MPSELSVVPESRSRSFSFSLSGGLHEDDREVSIHHPESLEDDPYAVVVLVVVLPSPLESEVTSVGSGVTLIVSVVATEDTVTDTLSGIASIVIHDALMKLVSTESRFSSL